MKKTTSKSDKLSAKLIDITIQGRGQTKKTVGEVLNLTDVLTDRGDWGAVVHLLQQVVASVPGHETAWAKLFRACDKSGNSALQIKFATQALAKKPRFLPALLAHAAGLNAQGNIAEAIDVLQKALKIKPASLQALNLLGIAYKELGKNEQALNAFNRCIAIKSDYATAYWNRSDLMNNPSDADIAAMVSEVARVGISDRQKIRLHYAIARAYEFTKNYERQFKHVEQAAKIKRAQSDYLIGPELDEMKAIPASFSSILSVDSAPRPSIDKYSKTPIFICGLPRSGTSLLEHVLSSHPDVDAAGEIDVLPRVTSQYLQKLRVEKPYPEWVEDLNEKDWSTIGSLYLEQTSKLSEKAFLTDKNLQNYRAIGVIKKALPQAKIIFCTRAPMDNLWGCYKQFFGEGQLFTYSQKDLGLMWQGVNDLLTFWKRELGDELFILNYEELVENQEKVTRELLEFSGLSWDERCLRFYENDRAVKTISSVQVRNPLTRSRIGQWKHYEEGLAELHSIVMSAAES